ncbi:MAG: 4-(cytidine 5'-diphospho)-2-C-methyl-D-erythritol kinase [Pseudomonadota bacterium]
MLPNKFRWPAPAKINLMLHILGRRDDGYHLLETHFQFIDWCDWISIEVGHEGDIVCGHRLNDVEPASDLSIQAAELLRERTGCGRSAKITLEKSIPMGAGLGGGSSDAATVLVALNCMWELGLTKQELLELGLTLGADVPVFIGGEAAFATGVGEHLTPLSAAETPILVIFPACHVNTGAIFGHSQLTRDTPSIKIHDLSRTPTTNDCEQVTRELYPPVDEAMCWLDKHGDAKMSGTGASVFATFDSSDKALALAELAQTELPSAWMVRVLNRINRSPLLQNQDEYRHRRR